MALQTIIRWRTRLLTEQPKLTDLPHHLEPRWWTNSRILWRGFAIMCVLILSFCFAPWPLSVALLVAASYAIIVHPGWNQDERKRNAVALRQQTLPLLLELSPAEFATAGRFGKIPFDATSWLGTAWGNHRSSEIFQILGWQQELLIESTSPIQGHESESREQALRNYLHETKPATG